MIETPAGATRVLVVDDEPSITDLVSMALRYEQFDVRVAEQRARGARRRRELLARTWPCSTS